MARKPSGPLLPFPDDAPAGDGTTVLETPTSALPEGDSHALQNDRPRTSPATTETARPASPEPVIAERGGVLREGAEDQPQNPESAACPGQTGQRQTADCQRSAGSSD